MAERLVSAERAAYRELVRARSDLARLSDADAPPRRRGWFGAAVAVVVVAALLAAIAVGWRANRTTYSDADYRQFATDAVSLLLTPDARDPDRARRILDLSTGAFRDQFAQSTDAYSAFVARLSTVATGTVDGVAIARRDGDSMTVLVTSVVTTRVGAATGPSDGDTAAPVDGEARRFRLQAQIEPDGGALKLAAVEFLP